MKSELSKRFGQIIKKFRIESGLSQEKLAEKAGVHRTYVGMVERGEKNITLENIRKFSDALEVDMKVLFEKIQ